MFTVASKLRKMDEIQRPLCQNLITKVLDLGDLGRLTESTDVEFNVERPFYDSNLRKTNNDGFIFFVDDYV